MWDSHAKKGFQKVETTMLYLSELRDDFAIIFI